MPLSSLFSSKIPLRFREDGSFRVLMMSDMHHAPDTGTQVVRAMDKLIERTKPDFVLLGGDNTTGKWLESQFEQLLSEIAGPMEKRNIPWAHVFGNHDISREITKEYQQEVYEKYPHCLSKAGDADLPGVGNWFLPVYDKNDSPVFGFWGLDSHQDWEMPSAPFGYKGDLYHDLLMPNRLTSGSDSEYITFEQVQWYYNNSKLIERELGRKLPSLMMFHVPLPEFNAILMNANKCSLRGENNEKVCCSEVNSGMFAAMLRRGDVKAVFCGHDHNNTFDGIYCGIRMGFDGSIGYHAYGLKNHDPRDREALRGGRIFDIDLADPENIRTEMVFVND